MGPFCCLVGRYRIEVGFFEEWDEGKIWLEFIQISWRLPNPKLEMTILPLTLFIFPSMFCPFLWSMRETSALEKTLLLLLPISSFVILLQRHHFDRWLPSEGMQSFSSADDRTSPVLLFFLSLAPSLALVCFSSYILFWFNIIQFVFCSTEFRIYSYLLFS